MIIGNKFEIKSGGGLWIFVGLPFFIFGAAILQNIYSDFNEGSLTVLSGFGGSIFGLIFTILGTLVSFGSSSIIIDKDNEIAIINRNLVLSHREKVTDLSYYKKIVIRKDDKGYQNKKYITYFVSLEGSALKIPIYQGAFYEKGISLAEELSNFLNLDIHDFTKKKKIIRKPSLI